MELRDEIGSLESAAPETIMAPPSSCMPPQTRCNLHTDTTMAPPNGADHSSQAGPSSHSTSTLEPDTLMAPPNGTPGHTSPGVCPIPSVSHPAPSAQPHKKALYFPVIDTVPTHHSTLSGTVDLLSLFNVSYMYDRFVRPYLKPTETCGTAASGSGNGGLVNGDLKGKGKADVAMNGTGPSESTVQKRPKMEKSYGHFVTEVGGRNSIKKDHQLETWIMDPNFQESSIQNFLQPFSTETLARSFALQPGLLPGFDTSVWVADEGGPKRKRKKRKQGEMASTGVESTTAPPPSQHPSHPHPGAHPLPISNSKEEDHRKKKRTKLNSAAPLQGPP